MNIPYGKRGAMNFRYENEKAEDAQMVCQVGDYDVWIEPKRKRICSTNHTGGYSWAPIDVMQWGAKMWGFEAFVAKYHNHVTKRQMVDAMRRGRDILFDPSISPNARASA